MTLSFCIPASVWINAIWGNYYYCFISIVSKPVTFFCPVSPMMTNLDCQHNCIRNHWIPKFLDTPVRDFLIRSFDVGWSTLNVGGTGCGSPDRRSWKEEVLLFACLPELLLANSSILLLRQSFTNIGTNFLRIPGQTEIQQLSGNHTGLWPRLGLQRHQAIWTEN